MVTNHNMQEHNVIESGELLLHPTVYAAAGVCCSVWCNVVLPCSRQQLIHNQEMMDL